MYQIVVFIHVLSVLLFMMVHGVSAVVMLVIERQEKPEHVRALLALRQMVSPAVAIIALIILATGVIAAFMGNWWVMGWPGVSLVLFIAITIVMTGMGRTYFDRVAKAVDTGQALAELGVKLRSNQRRVVLMVVGIGGMGVILWMMLFKPVLFS